MPLLQTTRSTLLRSLAAAAIAALLLASLAVPALAHGDRGGHQTQRGQALGRISPGIGAELAQVRAATARYHNVEVALADGYVLPAGSPCAASPAGAMGYHYVNVDLILDGQIDPAKPEALLYLPGPNGQLRLVGVEYIDLAGTAALFDQPFTDPVPSVFGPDARALHVWLWQANPAGMFTAFNPNLSCPA